MWLDNQDETCDHLFISIILLKIYLFLKNLHNTFFLLDLMLWFISIDWLNFFFQELYIWNNFQSRLTNDKENKTKTLMCQFPWGWRGYVGPSTGTTDSQLYFPFRALLLWHQCPVYLCHLLFPTLSSQWSAMYAQ